MSTATTAVVVMGACDLATVGGAVWVSLRVADRLRLVSPPKIAAPPETAGQEKPAHLDDRRAA
jgi:hypothetical protein